MLLSCGLGHRRISALPGLHKAVASHNYSISSRSRVHSPRYAHELPLTNPRHTLLSCTILLACLTSKPLFFKQSFMVSIHFYSLPTERLPAHFPTLTLLPILSFSILSTWPNHQRTASSIFSSTPFIPLHNCLIHAFGTLSILLISSRPLRFPSVQPSL